MKYWTRFVAILLIYTTASGWVIAEDKEEYYLSIDHKGNLSINVRNASYSEISSSYSLCIDSGGGPRLRFEDRPTGVIYRVKYPFKAHCTYFSGQKIPRYTTLGQVYSQDSIMAIYELPSEVELTITAEFCATDNDCFVTSPIVFTFK
ncbi:hypothetical protein ACMZOO_10025 [Catenovulum sp. SX2]|uniref:hypothetical protein n=1 Tax=Catenovulum sp. SX2 TaxID=3398614 RepID=UPI003F824F17